MTIRSFDNIEIPADVTYIGEYAFYYSNLRDIIIPASVEEIGYSALQNCTGLTEFHYPLSLKTAYPDILSC